MDQLPFAQYHIDCVAGNQIYERLKPKVTIHIDYSNSRCSFKIASVESFLLEKENVIRLNASEVEITKADLPEESQIMVIRPAP